MTGSFASIRFLLQKYLFPKGGGLLNLALWMSVVGVALGVAILVVVLSVMSGFLNMLETNYTKITSEIVVLPHSDVKSIDPLVKKIRDLDFVEATTPFLLGQGMVIKNGVGGVTFEGVSRKESPSVIPWKEIWSDPPSSLDTMPENWIWLGQGLSDKLHVKKGDTVNLMVPSQKQALVPFVVTGITKFGIYDHDLRYAYIDLEMLKRYFKSSESPPPFIKVKLKKGADIGEAAYYIKEQVKKEASIKKWSDINHNIFVAVNHQKGLLFLILEIIVALAGVNVINLLMMSAHFRKRDIAILRAMGMRFRGVVGFYTLQGTLIGAVGVGVGLLLGVLGVKLFAVLQPDLLNESIYNVKKLPFKVEAGDLEVVSGVAILICLIFSVVPAIRAAKQRPVEALRYE